MTIGKIQKKGLKKFIVIPNKGNDIFDRSDKTDTQLVYVKSIKGEPVSKIRFGKVYRYRDIEIISEPKKLYSSNTVKTLMDTGVISHEYDEEHPVCRNWLLSELIQNDNSSDKEMLTAVYEDAKHLYKDSLTAWVSLASNPVALEWLFDNGAHLAYVSGYGNPIEHHIDRMNVYKTFDCLRYLMKRFNCENVEELKTKVEKQ